MLKKLFALLVVALGLVCIPAFADQDIVAAVSAAIAVLQGKDLPAPFKFASKKEALRLLAHYVGDIHQPLHVAAVYVDAGGHVIDPDMGTFDPQDRNPRWKRSADWDEESARAVGFGHGHTHIRAADDSSQLERRSERISSHPHVRFR
jgi:hypothetical protein